MSQPVASLTGEELGGWADMHREQRRNDAERIELRDLIETFELAVDQDRASIPLAVLRLCCRQSFDEKITGLFPVGMGNDRKIIGVAPIHQFDKQF
nr:hypothetical protein [Paracoccus zhejiangensis]